MKVKIKILIFKSGITLVIIGGYGGCRTSTGRPPGRSRLGDEKVWIRTEC